MNLLFPFRRKIAAILLVVIICECCCPCLLLALTTGPTQPEICGFEPASTSNLVDPFSGDFTYNIPLMDIGGYPVNLAYHSGGGMDDESGWVGFGWSLSPGVVEREMRGLPDDFRGDGPEADQVIKTFHMRDDITGGIDFSLQPELFGFNTGALGLGAHAGIFYNNKRGIGISFGLDANAPILATNQSTAGTNTAGLTASLGLAFNSQTGASFNPTINFSVLSKTAEDNEKNSAKLSQGLGFQSRAGLQWTSLGASFNRVRTEGNLNRRLVHDGNFSYMSFAAQPFLPQTEPDFFNESYAITPQLGPEAWGFFAGLQLTGHYTRQKLARTESKYNAYGYLNSSAGRDDRHALLDFNREKDIPYFDGVPSLPVPVALPDFFMVHSQDGSAQYRAYSGGAGIFGDHDASNAGINASLGLEIGGGAGFKIGGDPQASLSQTNTGHWKTGDRFFFKDINDFEAHGEFPRAEEGRVPDFEPVYFKRVGELVNDEGGFSDNLSAAPALRIKTRGTTDGPIAESIFTAKDNHESIITDRLIRTKRAARNSNFSYLSCGQVEKAGLDKQVIDFREAAGGFHPFLGKCTNKLAIISQQGYRKSHHIGEITVLDDEGGRKIYGIPAYNTYQEDVSFSIPVSRRKGDRDKGLVAYNSQDASIDNHRGTDHYYSKEVIPGYAHAFLLTGILSPDYVDRTGNGITDDDLGSALRFNYWRKTNAYQWRTPYAAGMANYNEGLKSDTMDDRANYSYGRKELWYLHSIESKTMVAVFETANREDGLGADPAGYPDTDSSKRQQYLKTISLYSKADWYRNGIAATPIETVHFVYDYSLFASPAGMMPAVPNNTGRSLDIDSTILANQGGKLTLKKIYYTWQNNKLGYFQPYEFDYDFNAPYAWKQYDRWGNYKAQNDNPNALPNDEFPYSVQDRQKADGNASLWQLTGIHTPAGAIMRVNYESDDYCYVQNRKAMQMYPMTGLGSQNRQASDYYSGDKIFVELPQAAGSSEELRMRYFGGETGGRRFNLFFRACVRLKFPDTKYEYVSGYAEIENVNADVKLADGTNNIAEIKVRKIKGEGVTQSFHPIAKAAWQFMRLNTPFLVYPGYQVREDVPPLQFVKALVGAISSVSELLAPFDSRAALKKLAPEIDLSRSSVRLETSFSDANKIDEKTCLAKLGGGSRVKQITISDEWNAMSGSSARTAIYGTAYDYTTMLKLPDGSETLASSGVASYEPMVGNEENPFHQPVSYIQNFMLGPDNDYFIDEPFCESYFPGASVGYSHLVVRQIGADGSIGANGSTVYDYYTQKDFPTLVSRTPLDVQRFGTNNLLQMFNIRKNNSRVLSQGFCVELNDMHGKPRSEKILDRAGNEISSTTWIYKTDNAGLQEQTLSGEVQLLKPDGSISGGILGRETELYSDMRSQTTITAGLTVMVNIDALYLFFALVPIPSILPLPSVNSNGFRSASTVKIIQRYGILEKIVSRQNGSVQVTDNMVWDAVTGKALVSRTPNEFNDPVYHLNYPAHWAYAEGLGPACINLGLVLKGFVATAGTIQSSESSHLLVSGDELLVEASTGESTICWVNSISIGDTEKLVLVDANGQPVTIEGKATLIRSGRRNMQSLDAGSLVSLENPIKNGRLNIGTFTRVLDAGGQVFSDEWPVEMRTIVKTVQECPPGYLPDRPGRCYKDSVWETDPSYNLNTLATAQLSSLYSSCGTFLSNNPGAWNSAGAADPSGSAKTVLSTSRVWQNGLQTCVTGEAADSAGPLNRSGIWITEKKSRNYLNEWIGIRAKIFLGENDVINKSADGKTGYLFLGFGGQHDIEVSIDNSVVAARNRNSDNNNSSPFRTWRIKALSLTLNQPHEVFIRAKNESANSAAVLGVEIYDNSFSELKGATCIRRGCLPCQNCTSCRLAKGAANERSLCDGTHTAKIIWSSRCLVGKRFNYHLNTNGNLLKDFDPGCAGTLIEDDTCGLRCRSITRTYAKKITRTYCDFPLDQPINPYTTGLRGNWHVKQAYVYHTGRNSALPYIRPGDLQPLNATDIRKSGAYEEFTPFWSMENGRWLPPGLQAVKDKHWEKTSETDLINSKGEETDKSDALGRHAAALFGYLQSMTTAVCSNASYPEIVFDGFEDYDYSLDNCYSADSCNMDGSFSLRKLVKFSPATAKTDGSVAHSGRYSLRITANGMAVMEKDLAVPSDSILYFFSGNMVKLSPKGIMPGYRPVRGRPYLVSLWIRDEQDATPDLTRDKSSHVQLQATENGKAAVDIFADNKLISTTVKAGPRVEGWRKVEALFTLPLNASGVSFHFRAGSSPAWFDDIRIHPFDGMMKSYAYDSRTARLMAILDENNFASFYEYDDQGQLIREKKETELGIMTVKEIRTNYKIRTK